MLQCLNHNPSVAENASRTQRSDHPLEDEDVTFKLFCVFGSAICRPKFVNNALFTSAHCFSVTYFYFFRKLYCDAYLFRDVIFIVYFSVIQVGYN